VYMSLDMTEEEFNCLVVNVLIGTEMVLNTDMRLRWHIKDAEA